MRAAGGCHDRRMSRFARSDRLRRAAAAATSPRGALVTIALAIVALFVWIVGWSPEPPVATGVGGLAVLTAAALTFYGNTRAHDETVTARTQAHARETIRDLRARFTTSTEQLASEQSTNRLAGVYALAALADEWTNAPVPPGAANDERQVCIDVLCAYLRSPVDPSDQREVEVRRTIVRIIGQRTKELDPNTGEFGDWQDCDFDLTGADLPRPDWSRSRFGGRLDLSRATLSQGIDLSNSELVRADFLNTTFGTAGAPKLTTFKGARFVVADFDKATFHGTVKFERIVNTRAVYFSGCRFMGGHTSYRWTTFRPDTNTSFASAEFRGYVYFNDCAWTGYVTFSYADFSGTLRLSFDGHRSWAEPPRMDWSTDNNVLPGTLDGGRWPPRSSSERVEDDRAANSATLPDDDATPASGSPDPTVDD